MKLNENQKVTLTIDQLKKLIHESVESDFEIKDGVVIKYKGKDRNIVFPDGVTAIGKGRPVIYSSRKVSSVVIPDSVVSIGANAFALHNELKSVTLGNSVKEIGSGAFMASGIKSIVIPDSVETIGKNAFQFCWDLEKVRLPRKLKKIDILSVFENTKFAEDRGFFNKHTLFEKASTEAFDYITKHIESFKEWDWGMTRVQAHLVSRTFMNFLAADPYRFNFDNLRHAHGIGNNHEWDVLKDGRTVGTFYCVDDMFGGVVAGITIGGAVVERRKW